MFDREEMKKQFARMKGSVYFNSYRLSIFLGDSYSATTNVIYLHLFSLFEKNRLTKGYPISTNDKDPECFFRYCIQNGKLKGIEKIDE